MTAYGLTTTVDASTTAVALSRVKSHLRIATGDFDRELFDVYIPAAVDYCEAHTHRKWFTSTHKLTLYSFPVGPIHIPYGALQSITSVAYLDENGDPQVMDAADYTVDITEEPAQIISDEAWPTTDANVSAAVTVVFVSGYGALWTDLPPSLHAAFLLMVEHLWSNRGPAVIGRTISSMPLSVASLLDIYKLGDAYTMEP